MTEISVLWSILIAIIGGNLVLLCISHQLWSLCQLMATVIHQLRDLVDNSEGPRHERVN